MIVINSNGSHWGGEAPDSVDALLQRLATTPLDPVFEEFGNFITRARLGRMSSNEDGKRVYVDVGPIYPESPEAIRFCGNFRDVSAVFSIDTDEPELIEKLTQAIRANQASPAYQSHKEPA